MAAWVGTSSTCLPCLHEVDGIGLLCAASYGLLIPCFLVLLFAKQHLVMLPSKTFLAVKKLDEGKVTLEIHHGEAAAHLEEPAKRLLAAAAAYIAQLRGPVLVELLKDRVMLGG